MRQKLVYVKKKYLNWWKKISSGGKKSSREHFFDIIQERSCCEEERKEAWILGVLGRFARRRPARPTELSWSIFCLLKYAKSRLEGKGRRGMKRKKLFSLFTCRKGNTLKWARHPIKKLKDSKSLFVFKLNELFILRIVCVSIILLYPEQVWATGYNFIEFTTFFKLFAYSMAVRKNF